MSDGPYRSLPMSRSWKRLAEFSQNENFDRSDIRSAALNALEKTWQAEVPASVIDDVRRVFLEEQSGLFADQHIKELEALSARAGAYGFAKLLIDHALGVLLDGNSGEAGLAEATKRALTAYAARAARQIEEHYCRNTRLSLTNQVRGRIEEALGAADLGALARQLSGLATADAKRPSLKHKGIDDGVPL